MPGGSRATNFAQLALDPLGLRPGGYLQYEDERGAHQINGSKVTAAHIEARRLLGDYRRNARRAARFAAVRAAA